MALPRTPLGVALSDFLGNGNLDVVVANYDSQSSVSVFLGNGDGTLQAGRIHRSYFHRPWFLECGRGRLQWRRQAGRRRDQRIAGDGRPKCDRAVGQRGRHLPAPRGLFRRSLHPNQTERNSTPKLWGWPLGDFNGDGKLDLAVGSYSNAVSVLAGNGDGTFQAAVAFEAKYFFPYAEDSYPYSIAVGDFNGDGELDLAVADVADLGYASVLLNTTVELPATTTTLQSSLNPSTVGQSVTFTATVSSYRGNAYQNRDLLQRGYQFEHGDDSVGLVTLSNGAATFTTSALGVGIQSITAFYGSNSSFRSSTSAVLKQTVLAPAGVAGVSASSLTFGNQNLRGQRCSAGRYPQQQRASPRSPFGILASEPQLWPNQQFESGSVAVSGYCTIHVTFSPDYTATGRHAHRHTNCHRQQQWGDGKHTNGKLERRRYGCGTALRRQPGFWQSDREHHQRSAHRNPHQPRAQPLWPLRIFPFPVPSSRPTPAVRLSRPAHSAALSSPSRPHRSGHRAAR